MNYYRICQDKGLPNQIQPILLNLEPESKKPIFIRGRLEAPQEYAYFPPLIEAPVLMISEPVKKIWDCYQSGWRYRPCALGSIEQKRIQVYWIAEAKLINGLSEKTEYQKDGSFKRIVLSKEKIQFQKVFAIQNLHKTYYIAEKEILERMLQEHIHGFIFEQVKTV